MGRRHEGRIKGNARMPAPPLGRFSRLQVAQSVGDRERLVWTVDLRFDGSCCCDSGPLDQAYQEQQDHGPDGGVDDGTGNPCTDAQAQPREYQAGHERADNPDHDVAKQAIAIALDDQPCEPARHGADQKYDKQTFECHYGSFPLFAVSSDNPDISYRMIAVVGNVNTAVQALPTCEEAQ